MSALNQAEVNIDGKFKLGLTIAVETIPGTDNNGIIVVQKVDVGSQCEGRIFEKDLIICLDQQRLAHDRPMDHFQKLLEMRRRLGCVFSVTVMRNTSPQQVTNAANAPDLSDPNTMHHSIGADSNLHRTGDNESIQMDGQQSMPSNPLNRQNNVSISTSQSVTNNSKAQHPILSEDKNEKAKTATPSVHVSAKGKTPEKIAESLDIYEIVLKPGPLGLTLVKENRVKRVDQYKQCAGKVAVGDYMVEFDGIDTSNMTMEDVTVIAKERAGKSKTAKLRRYNRDRSFIAEGKSNETPTKQGVTDLKKESPWTSIASTVELPTTQEKQSSQRSITEGGSNVTPTQQEVSMKKKAQSSTVNLSNTQEKLSSQRSIAEGESTVTPTQQEVAMKRKAQSPWPNAGNTVDLSNSQEKQSSQRSIAEGESNETTTQQEVAKTKKVQSPWPNAGNTVDLSNTQEKHSSQRSITEGKGNDTTTQQEVATKEKAQPPWSNAGNTVDLSNSQENHSSQRSIIVGNVNDTTTQQEVAAKEKDQSPWPTLTGPGDQYDLEAPTQQEVATKKKSQSASSSKAGIADPSAVLVIERQGSGDSVTKENSSPSIKAKNKSDSKPFKSTKRSKNVCDICRKPDGFLDCMNIQQCSSCGLSVHEDCYGLFNEHKWEKYPAWKCHPCSLIGKSVKLRDGDGTADVQITKRAMHCVLCPVAQGMHAMTPIYDTHGLKGQPIHAKAKNEGEGIAWVHSLCAQVLGSNVGTNSTVFGCYDDGLHIGGDELDEESDDDSDSIIDNGIDLDYKDAEGNILITSVMHHFVIDNDPDQSKRIIQFRRLQCHVCRLKDKKSKRIPIQCAWKDCNVAFHVGCAHFANESSRIEFFPGKDSAAGKPLMDLVARGFCKTHLNLVKKSGYEMSERDQKLFYETVNQVKRKSTALTEGDDGGIYDDEADDGVSSEEEHLEGESPPPKKKAKRHQYATSTKPRSPTLSQNSAYLERKKQIIEFSLQMVTDLENRLKKSTVEKAVKNVSNHWKKMLSKSMYKLCKERNKDARLDLIAAYSARESHPAPSREIAVQKRRQNNRWESLWLPHFVYGSAKSTLRTGWDAEKEVADPENVNEGI